MVAEQQKLLHAGASTVGEGPGRETFRAEILRIGRVDGLTSLRKQDLLAANWRLFDSPKDLFSMVSNPAFVCSYKDQVYAVLESESADAAERSQLFFSLVRGAKEGVVLWTGRR